MNNDMVVERVKQQFTRMVSLVDDKLVLQVQLIKHRIHHGEDNIGERHLLDRIDNAELQIKEHQDGNFNEYKRATPEEMRLIFRTMISLNEELASSPVSNRL